jgi:hypothetical protein
MASGYPDWTGLVDIIGSDVMVPIDIQAGYVMMPVDLQAQYITLKIDIVAQSIGNIAIDIAAQTLGNINVNINAQTANINVDIKASSVTLTVSVSGTANIQITSQTAGVYLQPEWSAFQGTDKEFYATGDTLAFGNYVTVYHNVPGGKKFFLCGFAWGMRVKTATDYDHHLWCEGGVYTSAGYKFSIPQEGGGSINLTKPLVVLGGEWIYAYAQNYSNLETHSYVSYWGYEI